MKCDSFLMSCNIWILFVFDSILLLAILLLGINKVGLSELKLSGTLVGVSSELWHLR